jgi:hypothetical protein
MYDEGYMRRRLTLFYVLFYLSSFGVALLQNWFLYDALPLILFNSTIWVPQIIKTFVERTRRGPPMQLALSFMALQSFLPLYLKMYRGNFLDHQTNILTGIAMLLLMMLQLIVMYLQQKLGPRWFVPKKWRLGVNEHNYFQDVPHRRSLTDEEGAQEEMTCVICMNDIRHEVDAFGGVIEQPEQKRISRFKQIFSIGLP